jgi:hypothetical protein
MNDWAAYRPEPAIPGTAAARSGERVHELTRVNLPTPAEKSELEAKRRPRFAPRAEIVSRYPYSSASRLATLGQEVLFLARRTS